VKFLISPNSRCNSVDSWHRVVHFCRWVGPPWRWDIVHFSRWVGAPTGAEGTVIYLPWKRNATQAGHAAGHRARLDRPGGAVSAPRVLRFCQLATALTRPSRFPERDMGSQHSMPAARQLLALCALASGAAAGGTAATADLDAAPAAARCHFAPSTDYTTSAADGFVVTGPRNQSCCCSACIAHVAPKRCRGAVWVVSIERGNVASHVSHRVASSVAHIYYSVRGAARSRPSSSAC
jgi:hypothetical protein